MRNSVKTYSTILFVLFFGVINAQYPEKDLKKFVQELNENIEIIEDNRSAFKSGKELDEESIFLSPFWDYDFEAVQPFQIDEEGSVSMKVKYSPENAESFIYSVKGNIKDLQRAVVDIYFVLEFKENSLEVTYEYPDSGLTESYNGTLIHFGMDQVNLTDHAEKAGIPNDFY